MPLYVLFHRGRPSTLQLRSATPREDESGMVDFEFDFIPREVRVADRLAFERELRDMGISFGNNEYGRKMKQYMLMVWNARGTADAEAIAAAAGDSDKVEVEAAVNAVLTNTK